MELGNSSVFLALMRFLNRRSSSSERDQRRWRRNLIALLVRRSDYGEDRAAIAEELLTGVTDLAGLPPTDDTGHTVFSHAVESGLCGVVRAILRIPRCRSLVGAGTPHPLWIAANRGRVEMLRILLEHRDRIDVRECVAPDGTTPLMVAIARQLPPCCTDVLKQFYSGSDLQKELAEFGEVVDGSRSPLGKVATAVPSRLVMMSQEFPLFTDQWKGLGDDFAKVPGREADALRMEDVQSQILDRFCCITGDAFDVDQMDPTGCTSTCKQ